MLARIKFGGFPMGTWLKAFADGSRTCFCSSVSHPGLYRQQRHPGTLALVSPARWNGLGVIAPIFNAARHAQPTAANEYWERST